MTDFKTANLLTQVETHKVPTTYTKFEIIDSEISEREMEDETDCETDFICFKDASWNILKTSVPSILGLIFEMLIEVVNLMFIGHLDDPVALAGVGLGNMMLTMICFSIGVGLNGAIDTLVSQAYGDKEYYLCGCYLNRGRIIQALFFVPQLIILTFSSEILILLGQDESSAEAAQQYITILLPGMFAMAQFETFRRYLQAIGNFELATYTQCSSMILHFIMSYILIFVCDLGVKGSAISTSITYWINLIVVILYLSYREGVIPSAAFHTFNIDSLKNWRQFLVFGVPSILMLCLEWWSFEVLAIFAGWFSVEDLAANIILCNFLGFLFNFSLGMSYVVGNLVGNSLGEMKPNQAKKYFYTSIVIITQIAAIALIFINLYRDQIPLIYTQQSQVVECIENVFPVFTITIFFDLFQGVESGSLRAIGYQGHGFVICLIGYWLITIPCAYIFSIPLGLKLTGIWLGVPIGSFITCVLYGYILLKTDWRQIAQETERRIRSEKTELEVPLTKL